MEFVAYSSYSTRKYGIISHVKNDNSTELKRNEQKHRIRDMNKEGFLHALKLMKCNLYSELKGNNRQNSLETERGEQIDTESYAIEYLSLCDHRHQSYPFSLNLFVSPLPSLPLPPSL
jgi:hypothetical protein